MFNTPLLNAINNVVKQTATPTTFTLEMTFVSASDSTYRYSPLKIENLRINQDATVYYTNQIFTEFMISLNDYANMFDHMQDLACFFTLRYCDRNGLLLNTSKPFQKVYRAAIVDPKDVRKEQVDTQYRTEFDRKVKIRLVEPDIYNVRHIEFNTIYQSHTVEDAIRDASNVFGITNLTVTSPDNIHLWDQILVPPTKSFANFYAWLHAKYGVYMNGMNRYYTDNHLFVYPPFDIAPTTEKTVVLYQAEEGMCAGNMTFAYAHDNLIEVVTNKVRKVVDQSMYGSENVGTSKVFLRSSELVDGVVQHDPVDGIKFNDDVSLSIALQQPKTLTPGAHKTTYAHATDNPYVLASHMAEHQATVVDVEWPMSSPFLIRPGLAVVYNSDQNSKVLRRTGIVEKLDTLLARNDLGPAGGLFRGTTNLTVRLQPEGVLTDTVST